MIRWSIIAAQLPGRTDNDIKNYWNTRLKKKLLGKQRKDQIYRRKGDLITKKARSPSVIPSSIVVSGNEYTNNSQDPYMPELPVMPPMPYTNQEPCFVSDHTSLRKLLIKLGGKFADDANVNQSINMVSHFPSENTLTNLHASSQNDQNKFIACSTPASSSSMPLNSQYNILPIQEGQGGNLPSVFEEMYYSTNTQQKLDGLEFLYGDMYEINTSGSSSVITCGDSIDWGEMSSLISTTTTNDVMNLSNFRRPLRQGMSIQDHAYDDINSEFVDMKKL